jgi:toxin ParE1/3/4
MSVEYHPAVERELFKIRGYYESKAPGLGREFIEEFDQQVLRISATPGRWAVLEGNLRLSLMRRFPYIIYFRECGPSKIRILVVKHERRHPNYGRNRR